MKSHRFSPEAEKRMKEIGWYFGREVLNEVVDQWLVLPWGDNTQSWHGYSKIFPVAWSALKEFGGLKFGNLRQRETGEKTPFHIDPMLVVKDEVFSREWVVNEWNIGKSLFPLGISYDVGKFAICMDDFGKVYYLGVADYVLGENIYEAMENLILNSRLVEIEFRKLNQDDIAISRRISDKVLGLGP